MKDSSMVVVNLTDSTQFERTKDFRFRHKDMDVTAMVPGLIIEAEGVGNAQGQVDATKVKFDPDEFGIQVAEEQQIMNNKPSSPKGAVYRQSGGNGRERGPGFRQWSPVFCQCSPELRQWWPVHGQCGRRSRRSGRRGSSASE